MMLFAIIVLVLFIIVVLIVSYKRVRSNTALVIWGKGTGENGLKIVTGGATFVLPILQGSQTLSLEPFVVDVDLRGALSKQNIRVDTPSTFTLAVSPTQDMLVNAARRILDLSDEALSEQSQDIILGQLRAVIAGLTVEEINADREKFENEVFKNVSSELAKLGLDLINVNIKDITDEGGYIEAIGRKASAEAVNQANINVANAEKDGEIGTNEALKDKEIKVAQFNTEREIGVNQANKENAVITAKLQAETIQGQNEAMATQRESEKDLAVKTAAFTQESEVAKVNAEIEVQKRKAERELEELRATQVALVKAEKEQIELKAEAEKNKRILEAEAQAKEILLKAEAEAKGINQIMEQKAAGYDKICKAVGQENLTSVLMIEQLVDVTKVKSDALNNLNIDKITVWDNPSSSNGEGRSGLNGFVDNFMTTIPAMHEIAKDAGVELPKYLGSMEENKTTDPKVDVSSSEEVETEEVKEVI
ncbi:SPFH domain-containing protein [Mollicutes bacterium LVI A0039]|nr:SPFH domain-containing protein [Mollicutes bacterium LVI A0039]